MRGEQTEHGHEEELPEGGRDTHDRLRQPRRTLVPERVSKGRSREACPSSFRAGPRAELAGHLYRDCRRDAPGRSLFSSRFRDDPPARPMNPRAS